MARVVEKNGDGGAASSVSDSARAQQLVPTIYLDSRDKLLIFNCLYFYAFLRALERFLFKHNFDGRPAPDKLLVGTSLRTNGSFEMIVMGRARVLFASHWILVLSSLRTSCKASHLPNIVILFADNLGYADVGVFGSSSTSRTPFLDSLAQDGIKFGNWNSAAHLCSASRAALLTAKYPVRTGIYPGVFKPDAVNGLLPTEPTLAEYLKEDGYATSIVGKWHLGHRPDFLPTNQGFDEWLGIPYHMSGGSIDEHTCIFDENGATWLPLYQNTTIIQQPVHVNSLALRYALQIENFIQRNANRRPFFLYVPFSHVHQLCAPRDLSEQSTCQWSHKHNSTFADSLEEMDWIAGRVLLALEETGASNDTLVLFTSDNGPWVAEQKCSGQKGPFEGRWYV